MEVTERHIEASAAMVEAEQAGAIARIHAELTAEGEPDCIDCGSPIPPKRRAAMPSARRCIHCQTMFEKGPL
mgnify:CR=1 FL=1